MKLAVLYAGQGAQHPGMGKEFYEGSPAFRAAFDSAELDFDLHRVCFEDPDGLLNQTEYTQPCMVAFACGVTAVLAEKGVKPAYLAGLSLGEYSALQAAGVFTAKQAIELTAFRAKAMAEANRLQRRAVCRSATITARGSWSSAVRKPLWSRLPRWQRKPVPAAASR